MALQRRGRRRYNPFDELNAESLSPEEISELLAKELGAKRIPDNDRTKSQQWVPTLEEMKEQEEMGLFSHLEGKIDVEAIPVNPFDYPDGVYTVTFKEAILRPISGQEKADDSLDFRYTIVDDDTDHGKKYAGKVISEQKWIASASYADAEPEKAEEMTGYAIQRIAQLGFGEDARTVDIADINAACTGVVYSLKLKKGNKEDSGSFVQWVKLPKKDDEDDLSDM